jgi:hypothetical protein
LSGSAAAMNKKKQAHKVIQRAGLNPKHFTSVARHPTLPIYALRGRGYTSIIDARYPKLRSYHTTKANRVVDHQHSQREIKMPAEMTGHRGWASIAHGLDVPKPPRQVLPKPKPPLWPIIVPNVRTGSTRAGIAATFPGSRRPPVRVIDGMDLVKASAKLGQAQLWFMQALVESATGTGKRKMP